ncbi:MAG: hypothetical protein KIS76_09150 [Pyrinomonadaceae bacterium]|nr:hypothetical protein [Pyrinomonadaceae bacterium]
MSNFARFLSVLIVIFVLTAVGFADTLRLKNGSIIKGKIITFGDGKFTVLIDDGVRQRTLYFSADEVDSISFDSNGVPAPATGVSTTSTPIKRTTEDGTTIITVGQNKPVEPAPIKAPEPALTQPKTTITTSRPITLNLPVLADDTANGWTNSGWVVRKGQRIRIKATGRISLGNGRYALPGGIATLPDTDKLIKNQPTGGLIAVIGADNNDFIFIGENYEFVAARDGDLFLGVNEGNLSDNSGSFDVTIEIDPGSGN